MEENKRLVGVGSSEPRFMESSMFDRWDRLGRRLPFEQPDRHPYRFSGCKMPAMDLPGYESESKYLLGIIDSILSLIRAGRPDDYLDHFNQRRLEDVGMRT